MGHVRIQAQRDPEIRQFYAQRHHFVFVCCRVLDNQLHIAPLFTRWALLVALHQPKNEILARGRRSSENPGATISVGWHQNEILRLYVPMDYVEFMQSLYPVNEDRPYAGDRLHV